MRPALGLLLMLALATPPLVAEDLNFGELRGRFVYAGEPPERVIIKTPVGDVEDETLLIDKKSRGVANVVVSLFVRPGARRVPLPADFVPAKLAPMQVRWDGLRLEPHIAVVLHGQTLEIANESLETLNISGDFLNTPPVAALIAPGKAFGLLPRPEKLPVRLSSTIKPWPNGYVVVSEHPFVAVSNRQGYFTIRKVPVGMWTFRAWQEKTGFVEDVTQDGKETQWKKGQFHVTIKEDVIDLGDIVISKKEFK